MRAITGACVITHSRLSPQGYFLEYRTLKICPYILCFPRTCHIESYYLGTSVTTWLHQYQQWHFRSLLASISCASPTKPIDCSILISLLGTCVETRSRQLISMLFRDLALWLTCTTLWCSKHCRDMPFQLETLRDLAYNEMKSVPRGIFAGLTGLKSLWGQLTIPRSSQQALKYCFVA